MTPRRIETSGGSGDEMRAGDLEEALAAHSLAGLWSIGPEEIPHRPTTRAVPQQWRWSDLEPLLAEAGRLIAPSGRQGTRRVPARLVCLTNSGLEGLKTTDTLCACLQHIGPGEAPPVHRHTYQAIRFVLAGHGAQTMVDGESLAMEPGDLIVTPGWSWHGHRNDSDEPAIWLDGVDLPLVLGLGVNFSEPAGDRELHARRGGPAGWTSAGVLPLTGQPVLDGDHGMLRYPWASTRQALDRLADDGADCARVAFVKPTTSAPVTTTFGCEMTRLAAGASTGARRETASSIVQAFLGRGEARIGEETFAWNAGDLLAIPHWTSWELRAAADAEESAYLFTMTDRPSMQALGFYRIQEH